MMKKCVIFISLAILLLLPGNMNAQSEPAKTLYLPFISTGQIEGTSLSVRSAQAVSARNAVDNVVVATSKSYEYQPCSEGDTLWSDRGTTITDLESQYHDMWCIKFANDDKDFSGANYAEFDLKTPALLILLEDSRVRDNDTVDWLEEAGFSKSQDIVEESGDDLPYLQMWKCKANPGRKIIGGPKHRGGGGGQSNWVLGVIPENNANTNYKECSYGTATTQPAPMTPADTIFVKPNGNGNGTESNPYGSIQDAINAARSGDTVHLLAGNYYEDIETVRHGSANARITIAGETDAILRGATGGPSRIFQIYHDYITVEGFTINGYDGYGDTKDDYHGILLYVVAPKGSVKRGPQHLTVRRMRFLNAGGECLRLKYFVRHAQIYLNHFENCGLYDFRFDEGGKNGEAIYVGTADNQWSDNAKPKFELTDDPDASNKNWIFKNTFITNGNECIEFKEGTRHNVAYNNYCTGQLDPNAAGITSRGNNNVIRDNITFSNVGAGIRVGSDSSLGSYGHGHRIYRNRIYDNAYGGIKFEDKTQNQFVCENDFSQGQTRPSAGSSDDEYESLVSANCDAALAGTHGYTNAPDDRIIAEAGITTLNHVRTKFFLNHTFNNPVVIGSITAKGGDTAVLRITNIGPNWFEAYIQEEPSANGAHLAERLNYLVVEAGDWLLAGGGRLIAGKVDTNATVNNNWQRVFYNRPFGGRPAVITQVQTHNDANYVKSRLYSTTSRSNFTFALEREENNHTQHGMETVGYIAIVPQNNAWGGKTVASISAVNTSQSLVTHNFGHTFTQQPVVLADFASYRGPDAAAIRLGVISKSGFEAKVHEDHVHDTEVNHAREAISYIAIQNQGLLYAKAGQPSEQWLNFQNASSSGEYANIDGLTERAMDGNTNGHWRNNSVYHSTAIPDSWWRGHLYAEAHISKIEIYNRTDCCKNRIDQAYVFASSKPFTSNDPDVLEDTEGVYTWRLSGVENVYKLNNINANARYFMIYDSGWLNFAEFKVYGYPAGFNMVPVPIE